MNDTQRLLAFIYKNAEMGVQTMPRIAEKSTGEFHIAVQNRLQKYEKIKAEAARLLDRYGSPDAEKAGLNGFEKMSTDMMMKMNLSMDSSVPHMADMLIKGSSMGIRDISEQMAKYSGADREVMDLAENLKKLEEDGLTELKKYLSAV